MCLLKDVGELIWVIMSPLLHFLQSQLPSIASGLPQVLPHLPGVEGPRVLHAGDIVGVQIRYLIDCFALNISELGSGVHKFSVFGIKASEGKTHSFSLRARTTAGWGNYSTPVTFIFRPIGEAVATPGRIQWVGGKNHPA